jgi:hypothetical protein
VLRFIQCGVRKIEVDDGCGERELVERSIKLLPKYVGKKVILIETKSLKSVPR